MNINNSHNNTAPINKVREYKEIIINLLKLSLPILGGNLSQLLIGFADSIAAGRYSTLALGAISVATALLMTITIGAIGLLLSISPVVSNFRGKKVPTKKYFNLILVFSIVVSIPFFLILELFNFHIGFLGFEKNLQDLVFQYINICAWTIFPTALFMAMKEFLQAWEKVVFPNILSFFMIFLNVILNFALTFGYDCPFFSIPSMGLVGIAYATFISKTLVAVILGLYCLPLFKNSAKINFIQILKTKTNMSNLNLDSKADIYSNESNYNSKTAREFIKELIRVGIPISAAIFFEFLGFNLTAVLIGKFSSMYAAVHNIILCIANFTFMIVLSISNASSIKIGYYNGADDIKNIKRYSIATIGLVLSICFVTFCLILAYSNQIITLFSKDSEVIYWCHRILKFAMIFLFFDGIQAACVGILKGLKDTKIIMFTMLFGYLGIAIPLGTYLAYYKNIVLEGYWIAIALGLFAVMLITSTKVILNIRALCKSL